MSVEAVFMKAGNLRRICELTLADGRAVRIEPYAIFTAPNRRRHFLWYQLTGESEEDRGWRQVEASLARSAKLCEQSYEARRDYDPFDRQRFPVVHYTVPTHDGRQRWADARPDFDKQTLRTKPGF